MAQISIILDGYASAKTAYSGATYYDPTKYFDIPANNGITSAVITFATHQESGTFSDRLMQFNGSRAHSGWLTSGMALNVGLLTAGSNSYRFIHSAMAGSNATWYFGSITLTIDYTPLGETNPTAPSVWGVTLAGSTAAQYRTSGDEVILNFSAANGVGNVISHYAIQYSANGGPWTWSFDYNRGDGNCLVYAQVPGTYIQYRVIAVAPNGDSYPAYSPLLYSYSAVKAPTEVTVSPSTVYPGASVVIGWSGAENGMGVAIAKYQIHRNDAYLGETTGTTFTTTALGVGSYAYKVYAIGNRTGYNSGASPAATLTVLANPSLVSPNKWSMAPLEVVRNTLTVYDNAYTHKITYSFHGSTSNVNLAAGVKTHDFTFPEAWLASRTTSATGSLVITVSTYSGATLIGTKAITITINIPSSYGPTIGSFTAVLVKNGGPASIERYIKGISKATLAAGAFVYQQGAYAVGFSISGGGYYSSNTSVTFGVFPTAGTITFTAAVLDSRGFTASKQVSIIVQEYSSPTLSGVAMFRCDEFGTVDSAGEYVSLKATSVFASIDGQNTATLQGRVYMRGGTPGAWTGMTSGTVLLLGGGLLSVAKTYISEIKITDKIGNYAITVIIPTDSGIGLHIIDGSLGAAIGKYAEREKFFELPDDWATNVNADKLDGNHASAFAAASHSHSYLPLAGGTLTGSVIYTHAFQYNAVAGGWARGFSYKTNDGSNEIGFIGALGNADTMGYLAMGATYNDLKGFRWYPNGTATLNGSQVLHASNYINYVYPVGAIYQSTVSTSPATLFGGTWSALPANKFIRTGTGGATGGSDTHAHSTTAVALTVAQMPKHRHVQSYIVHNLTLGSSGIAAMSGGTSGDTPSYQNTQYTGSGATHGHGNTGSASNVPAYYGVYAWRRTA